MLVTLIRAICQVMWPKAFVFNGIHRTMQEHHSDGLGSVEGAFRCPLGSFQVRDEASGHRSPSDYTIRVVLGGR